MVLTNTRSNEGLILDGVAGYVKVADADSLDLTTSATWALWMKQEAIDVTAAILGKGISTNLVRFYTSSNGLFYFVIMDGSSNSGYFNYSTAISANTWHYLTVVYDGSLTDNADRLKVYVDSNQNTLTFSGTIPSSLLTNSEALFIGDISSMIISSFNGEIDEVLVYNKALTSEEITKNYNAQKGRYQ